MRVLLLSQFYPPIIGGEERHVANLAAALADRGHQVSVATQWTPDADPFELDGAVKVHRIRGTMQRMGALFSEDQRRHAPPFPDPELVAGLRRVVLQEKPDIVHAHNWLYLSYLPLKKWSGVPLIVTLHDYSLVCPKKNHMQNDAVCRGPRLSKCLPCAIQHFGSLVGVVTTTGLIPSAWFARHTVDKFITVSRAVAHYNKLAKYDVPFEVIPNFVPDDAGVLTPADEHDCLRQLPPGDFILFVGDLMRLKGIEVLLDAYSRLPRSAPPLVLIGRKFPKTPSSLPLNVHHLGPWSHDAVMHAWDRCLFGVLPSIGLETFGIVIIEAMACGKPFIASDIGGMSDVVDHGETGLLVPPGDASALATAMNSLLTDPASTARMGQTASGRIAGLKATPVVSRIEEVYRALA
jgi:glycosyltransferase involved in cell wall biosynthesis